MGGFVISRKENDKKFRYKLQKNVKDLVKMFINIVFSDINWKV